MRGLSATPYCLPFCAAAGVGGRAARDMSDARARICLMRHCGHKHPPRYGIESARGARAAGRGRGAREPESAESGKITARETVFSYKC